MVGIGEACAAGMCYAGGVTDRPTRSAPGCRIGPWPGSAPASNRIAALDILRGLALFGVLAINLDTEFRVSFFEQFLPSSGPVPPLDRVAAALLSAAIEFKAFALFSLLFGAGLAIQFDSLAGHGDRTLVLVRRLLALLAFGMVHLLFVWNGDILTEYAIVGFVVLPLLFAPVWALALAAGAALVLYLALPWLPLPWSFPGRAWLLAHVDAARAVYGHGSYAEIQAFRVAELPAIAMLHGYVFPRTLGLMLLGALAWRTGLFVRAGRYAGLLRSAAAAALALGVVLALLAGGVVAPLGLALPRRAAAAAGLLAPIALALGYAALVIWAVAGTRQGSGLLAWAAPVGRMAFSNYLAQSVVLGLLFYGYGLGLIGRVGAASGLGLAVVIYAVGVCASRRWLRGHRFGPLEWLWRTLTYGRCQPWRSCGDERGASGGPSAQTNP